jgi:maleylacetate reductase
MLPHTIAFNAAAVPDLLAPIAGILGGSPGQALHALAERCGAPLRLKDLGLAEADLDRAADLAVLDPYDNPRPLDRRAIRALLQDAFDGKRPGI